MVLSEHQTNGAILMNIPDDILAAIKGTRVQPISTGGGFDFLHRVFDNGSNYTELVISCYEGPEFSRRDDNLETRCVVTRYFNDAWTEWDEEPLFTGSASGCIAFVDQFQFVTLG